MNTPNAVVQEALLTAARKMPGGDLPDPLTWDRLTAVAAHPDTRPPQQCGPWWGSYLPTDLADVWATITDECRVSALLVAMNAANEATANWY